MTNTAPTPHDPTTPLDWALTYADRGWRVIPIPSGQKHPSIPAWQTAGTTDHDRIRHWWTTSPHDGIGIVTGARTGLWVLDVDIGDGKDGGATLAALEATHGTLPDTHEVVTGSGGRHLYFAWPHDQEIRNDQSGRLGPGLDIRGEGGQVLAPPTIHPNGTPYADEVAAPDHIAPAPEWLLDLLRTPEPTPAPRRTPGPAGDRPGDLWAAQTTWDQLLTADGWTLHHTDRTGETHWTRPGKDRRDGTSATVGHKGSDVLKVFTSSMAPTLSAEETYTKLGYLAATRHGGDHSAAATALRDAGYKRPDVNLADLMGQRPDDTPWPDPTPLPAKPEPPPFPLDALPDWTVEHVTAVADAVQVPADLAATLTIGALTAAATGRVTVEVSPTWSEPMALYLVCALRSGAGKSPAAKATTGWLYDWDRTRTEDAKPAIKEARLRAEILTKRAKDTKESAVRGSMSVEDALEAAVQSDQAQDDIPTLPRLIADDATPEALPALMIDQPVAILSTEADLFDMVLRGKPGARANINLHLKAWSGDPYRRDRKGGTETGPEAVAIDKPLLTISTTVQPSVLTALYTDAETVGRGFTSRFMVSVPPDLIGRRDQSKRFTTARSATLAAYETRAALLATEWASWSSATLARFAPAAADALLGFMAEVEPQLTAGAPLAALAEWANKLHASLARYAALLHLAEDHSPSTPISADTAARAITLGRYWLAHAALVLDPGDEPIVAQAEELLAWIASEGVGSLTLSDMQKGFRRERLSLDKVIDYVAPVSMLIDLGWLRPVDNSEWRSQVGVRGSKSPRFSLWPDVIGRPQKARVSRVQRFASMGERDLSLLTPSHTPYPLAREPRNPRNPDPQVIHNPTGSWLDGLDDTCEDPPPSKPGEHRDP